MSAHRSSVSGDDAFSEDLRSIAESADAALRETHEAREQALTLSRRVVRSSANSIRAAHRGELDEARRLVAEAADLAPGSARSARAIPVSTTADMSRTP